MEKELLLGQVFTPAPIADRLVDLLGMKPNTTCQRILDPCVGEGALLSALARRRLSFAENRVLAYDIDRDMLLRARVRFKAEGGMPALRCADYLISRAGGAIDFAILNPPYVRQEWITRKADYLEAFETRYGIRPPGTSNLYVYFILKVLSDLRLGGRFSCVVYDSLTVTRFGRWLMQVISSHCDSIVTETIERKPFSGHLIDAVLLAGTKIKHLGSAEIPDQPLPEERAEAPPAFARLGDVFRTKRGLRLKQTDFFLIDRKAGAELGATPFVKKISHADRYKVRKDHPEAALLVDAQGKKRRVVAEIQRRLKLARKQPDRNKSILTWWQHRSHSWFAHAQPPSAPLLFNYYIRGTPRHLINFVGAYSDNFYGLWWDFEASDYAMLAFLNCSRVSTQILRNARNQGNGLNKLQLYEYREVLIPDPRLLPSGFLHSLSIIGRQLSSANRDEVGGRHVIRQADALLEQWLTSVVTRPAIATRCLG